MADGGVPPREPDDPRPAKYARIAEWYHRSRAELIAAMGGVCVTPGCGKTERLEFNHLERRTWIARRSNRWVRLAKYKREHAAGLLDLRCRSCNARAGKPHKGEVRG